MGAVETVADLSGAMRTAAAKRPEHYLLMLGMLAAIAVSGWVADKVVDRYEGRLRERDALIEKMQQRSDAVIAKNTDAFERFIVALDRLDRKGGP